MSLTFTCENNYFTTFGCYVYPLPISSLIFTFIFWLVTNFATFHIYILAFTNLSIFSSHIFSLLLVSLLVNWYFEPSHLQRITSGLKTMFNLSPIFLFTQNASHQTTNYPSTTKSVQTQMYRKHTQTSNNLFLKN